MAFRLIVTLGPSLNSSEKLKQIADEGPCIFRINGAHTTAEQIAGVVTQVRQTLPQAQIMLDLPGNKVRTAQLSSPIRLVKGETFELHDDQLNYPDFYKHVNVGDVIYANDSIFKLEVQEIVGRRIRLLSHSDGLLTSNKGFHAKGVNNVLPFLFPRDMGLIRAAAAAGVNILSLSFVRNVDDILTAKNALAENGAEHMEIFAKIETAMALENLEEILRVVNTVNVDRGDLSADIGLHNLPRAQQRIIHQAQVNGRAVFLATQVLKSMEHNPIPLIAEVMDLHKTIQGGISGIQLSEETAVGKYSVECVKTVFTVARLTN